MNKYIENFRKNIPKNFNQVKLLDYLFNDDIDHYISISNRTDGKTFNYINFFINLAIDKDIKFILISRNFTVRFSYCEIINNIVNTVNNLDIQAIEWQTTQFYRAVYYNKKLIGLITDLNEATNLKYFSQYIKNFDIIIYDEFLAIEDDYLNDEWERLKTIYSSVDRDFTDNKLIKHPKIFYLGNAVNFSSPILAGLNIYNILEKHQINTCNVYDNVCLEINKNENVNSLRNLRAFKEDNDDLTHSRFLTNVYNIANENDIREIKKNFSFLTVKLKNKYLIIEYNKETFSCILSIVNYSESYDFNTENLDNTNKSIFLKKSYYKDNFTKKYDKNVFLFKNEFSKNYILNDIKLKTLNIYKLLNREKKEKEAIYKKVVQENALQKIYNKIFN